MKSQNNKTAVLFFTLSAEAEVQHKQFTHGRQKSANEEIANSLIEHIQKQILDADLPCFQITEKHQVGQSFGERFANAFREIFGKGYEYVIAVGNDTPLLEVDHLTEAANSLESGEAEIVLGPSTDGGTWLMGYSRPAFTATAFQQLPWNSDHLLETILQQSKKVGQVDLLETLSDIDDPSSLQAFTRAVYEILSVQRLVKRIESILSAVFSGPQCRRLFRIPTPAFRKILLRAPPAS